MRTHKTKHGEMWECPESLELTRAVSGASLLSDFLATCDTSSGYNTYASGAWVPLCTVLGLRHEQGEVWSLGTSKGQFLWLRPSRMGGNLHGTAWTLGSPGHLTLSDPYPNTRCPGSG